LDQVITNIQNEPITFTKLVVLITEPTTVTTKSFQLVQLVVEPNTNGKSTIFKFQHVLVTSHFTKTLRHINMFLKQVAQNATSWSRTL